VTPAVTERFETWSAGWIHRVLLDEEEHRPLPDDPDVAMLVLRVSERLSLAAGAIQDYELVLEDDEEDSEAVRRALLPIAVYFLGATGFALTAVAHLATDPEGSTTERKNAFLDELDQDIAGTLETDDYLSELTPAEILYLLLAGIKDASQCAIELEGVNALFGEGEEEDDEDEDEGDDEDEPPTIDELLLEVEETWADAKTTLRNEGGTQLVDEEIEIYLQDMVIESLWDTAVLAAAAAETLLERYEAGEPGDA
jgi:hypothetical protein